MTQMKSRFPITILTLLLAVNLYAQPDHIRKNFESASLEKAESMINSAEGQQPLDDFAATALQSRRIDLITLCFENQYTMLKIFERIKELPDSSYKDRLVLMMIGSNSPFWPSNKPWILSQVPGQVMEEPFISVIKKYLPALPIEESLIDSHAARQKLAVELKDAIAKAGGRGRIEENKAPSPELPANTTPVEHAMKVSGTPNSSAAPSTRQLPQSPSVFSERRAPVLLWVAGIAALAAGVLIVWKLRA